MSDFALIFLSTVLVNNFVLVQFLGLCPFMGVSTKVESAIGMSMATTFVLTLASISSYIVNQYVLIPFALEYLQTISFILVIAAVVSFSKMFIEKTSPILYKVLGIYIPLITTNCAVLGVALQNTVKANNFSESAIFMLKQSINRKRRAVLSYSVRCYTKSKTRNIKNIIYEM